MLNVKEIEEKVNQIVFEGRPVVIKNMTKRRSFSIRAMALFDRKNGDIIHQHWRLPIEICGGYHVFN